MRALPASLLTCWMACAPAFADQVVLPTKGIERDGTIKVLYRLSRPVTGRALLTIDWRDAFGRAVEHREVRVGLLDQSALDFSLDLRRAVAVQNELRVHLSLDEKSGNRATHHRENDLTARFLVPPSPNPWRDYQIIVWHEQTANRYAALKDLGVTAGAVRLPDREAPERLPQAPLAALLANDLGLYVENIATDFYSAYHRWTPDHPVDWRFQQVKQRYAENPLDPATRVREPSLSDPNWLTRIQDRLRRTVRATDMYRPLFYDLADEPGIADLSIFWDFDYSAPSLSGLRTWLKAQYGTLSALNRQWGSHFTRWDQVMPMTTREAMARTDDNYSAWADFKEWMDVSFARALRSGTDAIHAVRKGAYAAIEGGQVPGWGGYDYARLAHAVDVMELYDGGGNLEVARSINPGLVILTTSAAGGSDQSAGVWRELLRGSRGLVLWDPDHTLTGEDGTLSSRGREAAGYLHEIRGGLGQLLINSRRKADQIAILYSPASMRMQWLLEWKSKGEAWARRDIGMSFEDPNAGRSSLVGFTRILEALALHPRFVSSDDVKRGRLLSGRYRLVILPHAISLAREEVEALRRFVIGGGVVVADTEPGAFDNHGRRLKRPALHVSDPASSPPARRRGLYLVPGAELCDEDATIPPCERVTREMTRILASRAIKPMIGIAGAQGRSVADVETYVFENGATTIVGLHRRGRQVSAGSDRPVVEDSKASGAIVLTLARRSHVYDLRRHMVLGPRDTATVAVSPTEPVMLAISPSALPALKVDGPQQIRAGHTGEFRIAYGGRRVSSVDIVHVDVIAPSGRTVSYYGGNVVISEGRGVLRVPFAANDPTGVWRIKLFDVLSCQTITRELDVAEGP